MFSKNLSGCFQRGEPDLMTAAKLVLHHWQRGKIPFFVPPPQLQDGPLDDKGAIGTNEDTSVNSDRETAAMKVV